MRIPRVLVYFLMINTIGCSSYQANFKNTRNTFDQCPSLVGKYQIDSKIGFFTVFPISHYVPILKGMKEAVYQFTPSQEEIIKSIDLGKVYGEITLRNNILYDLC